MRTTFRYFIEAMVVLGIIGAIAIFVIKNINDKQTSNVTPATVYSGTLRSTAGKIIAVGPRYVTVENAPGKTTSLEFVTNLDPIRTKAEDFLRKQQKVVIVYRTKSISQYENETAIDSLTPNP